MASQRELVKQLFGAALDLMPDDRAAFLDRKCNGNPKLRQEVEVLLAANTDAGSFLERPTEDIREALRAMSTTIIGPTTCSN